MSVAKAGECHDSKGYPIHPGDLVRSFHFVGVRKRRHWLYHVAVESETGHMEMVPTSELSPSRRGRGGRFWLTQDYADSMEMLILSGSGPGDFYDFEQRARVRS